MGDTATAARRVAAIGCDVLWVGKPGPAMSALPQRGARVEQVGLEHGVERVTKRAPDLVVLNVGNAQAVAQFSRALRKRRAATTPPVIVLCDDDAVAPLQAAERSGIVARLDASASGEEVALALDAQLRTQTEALREQRLPITVSELAGWIALADKKGVCGLILAQEGSHVMVLGPGGASVPTAQRFREALAAATEPSLSFLQLPAARVRVLTELARTPPKGESEKLPAVRVAVSHPDPGVRSLWERHMAFAGAEVLFDEVQDGALSTLGESAPDLLVVHEHALLGLTRAGCWRDVRLQFTPLLVVSASCALEVHAHDLVAEAARLLATQARLQARIAEAELLVERVESLGPARWLREVQAYDGPTELRVHTPQGSARLRMDSGELHEARYFRDGQELHGNAALTALLDARFGCLIAGSPEQVADADRSGRLPARLEAEPGPCSTIAQPPAPAEREAPVDLSSGASALGVADGTVDAATDEPESERRSSPEVQPGPPPPSPDAAPAIAFPSELADHDGAPSRSRAIAVGALALLAILGAAVWLQAPRPAQRSATPAGAVVRSARPVSQARPEVVAIPPAGGAPTSPQGTEAPADEVLGVVQQAADEEPSAAQPAAADQGPSAAQPAGEVAPAVPQASADTAPEDAPGTQTQPQQQALTPVVANGAANVDLVANKTGAGAPELPLRLRRWPQPTPAQQRIIEAFWARVEQNFAKAERLLSEAHALDPKDPEAAYQLALTFARQGRLEQTLSWARQARELSPLDPAPVALEGDILSLRGKPLEAEQAWKQCLRVRPGYPGCVRRLEQAASRRAH